MRIWLSKNSDVPLREQLATQILLGIVSEDLKPGQKLPSTRELAHRYDIHSNTVSAAYRELAHRGWVEFRKGSGVYVRDRVADAPPDATLDLDQLISTLFQIARERGYSVREIQAHVKRWLEAQPPDHFLVIESDVEMRNVLIAEIEEATGFRALGSSIRDCAKHEALAGAAPVAMYGVAEQVRAALPPQAAVGPGFDGGSATAIAGLAGHRGLALARIPEVVSHDAGRGGNRSGRVESSGRARTRVAKGAGAKRDGDNRCADRQAPSVGLPRARVSNHCRLFHRRADQAQVFLLRFIR